ncbi:MAG: hypothetical protein M1813_003104 [Trichoglossum hirsutum]|nr:MAG: hypothetical protein M1813_003104 [Trichoglossum hirsutum]
MATPRLPFLHPHIFKSLRSTYEPLTQHPKSYFHTSSRHHVTKRHGSAVEHAPFGVPPLARNDRPAVAGEKDGGVAKEEGESGLKEGGGKEQVAGTTTSASPPPIQDLTEERPHQLPSDTPNNPLDELPPTSLQSPSHQPPPPQPPPYTHHFDTYTLVETLTASTLSPPQSLTLTLAIHSLLTHNVHLAHDLLLPKSSVSNQSYLFQSAISELKTEIQNMRAREADQLRSERNRLQHEVDILSQRLGQELAAMREELKALFGDRRMAVRSDQREMEGRIQELNYKITVMLGSDMKSEVEGLRWVLTRRAALAIATMAFLILGSLRYSSYHAHLEQQRQQQHHHHQQQSKQPEGHSGREGSETPTESRE